MPRRRSTLGDVQPTTAAILGGAAGLLIGFLVWAAITMSDRERAAPPEPEPEIPRGVGDVLAVLRSSGVVLDRDGRLIALDAATGQDPDRLPAPLLTHLMPLFAAWQQHGLAEIDGARLQLTLAGRFWNVNMQAGLFEFLQLNPLDGSAPPSHGAERMDSLDH